MAGQFSKAITAKEVKERLEQGERLSILDVREPDEWEAGHIDGARHIPLGLIVQRHKELNPGKETIVVCRSGNRSGLACELLESMGYSVANMTGGMSQWGGQVKYGS
ncbi:MAG: rhodanese protein [Paenibacillus sp.]|jgi:rhodanese-related sulfurtransferase|nr:rhodanese protein [Paenibacillus sp.]